MVKKNLWMSCASSWFRRLILDGSLFLCRTEHEDYTDIKRFSATSIVVVYDDDTENNYKIRPMTVRPKTYKYIDSIDGHTLDTFNTSKMLWITRKGVSRNATEADLIETILNWLDSSLIEENNAH